MTTHDLRLHLTTLLDNIDPTTGEVLGEDSALALPTVRDHLEQLLRHLKADPERLPIGDDFLRRATEQLCALGYRPNVEQLTRVLYGSRATADDRLRGLPFFRQFRGQYSRRELLAHVKDFRMRHPDLLEAGRGSRGSGSEYGEVTFFREAAFNTLDDGRRDELRRAVAELPEDRLTEDLPTYQQRARHHHPRAYASWTDAERALLVEAMCYTNDLEELRGLFGRSAASLEREGCRLIWSSRRRAAAA